MLPSRWHNSTSPEQQGACGSHASLLELISVQIVAPVVPQAVVPCVPLCLFAVGTPSAQWTLLPISPAFAAVGILGLLQSLLPISPAFAAVGIPCLLQSLLPICYFGKHSSGEAGIPSPLQSLLPISLLVDTHLVKPGFPCLSRLHLPSTSLLLQTSLSLFSSLCSSLCSVPCSSLL